MPTKTPSPRKTAKGPDLERILRIIRSAREQRRNALLETESMELVRELGLRVPGRVFVRDSKEAAKVRAAALPGDRAVVKVVSADILHKSDVGGVAIVENSPKALASAVLRMEKAFQGKDVSGYTLNECVDYDRSLGGELLLGMRWTADCGPIVTFGPGGIYTEFLAGSLKPGKAVAIVSAELCGRRELEEELRRTAVCELLAGGLRGQAARVDPAALADAVRAFTGLAKALMPEQVSEFEVNPLVISGGRLVALDARTLLGLSPAAPEPERPIGKIKNLLEARSAALVGVSEKMNVGHVILNNMLKEGFAQDRIYVVKPGSESIEGCRCVPDVPSLPERVDMAVISVPAANVSEVATAFIETEKAESLIVIPGGLEEKAGKGVVSGMHEALAKARRNPWRGPVINGGNCLGIRSVPGSYDTMFIPDHKKSGAPRKDYHRLALVSQSGAFAVSKMDKLSSLAPKYSISIGNQTDLTIGDYLTYLKDDPELEVFAVYVEGFKPLDGLRFLKAAREIRKSGRSVILYRAGRTTEGQKASASHTASIAQDYAVTQALARQSGVVVAETLSDFEELVRLFVLLKDKKPRGLRLGALSNAGFECVAIADNLGAFQLPEFSKATAARLADIFKRCRIDEIVDVHNPLDLTPMAADTAYEDAVRAVLEDPSVDLGVVGCVPLTPALNTLSAGEGHREDIASPESIATRLLKVKAECPKPWVAVIDAGWRYDPLCRLLEGGGVPVFRSEDTALRLLNVFAAARK